MSAYPLFPAALPSAVLCRPLGETKGNTSDLLSFRSPVPPRGAPKICPRLQNLKFRLRWSRRKRHGQNNDDPVFDHIRVIFRRGSRYLFARQQDRHAPIDAARLHLEEIPDTFLYAPVPAGWTRAPDPLPAKSYFKQPNLLDFGDTSNCCTVLLQEAEIYEFLRQHPPHPNIARYYGCVVAENNDRFRGICLQRYSLTLKQRVERRPPAKGGEDQHEQQPASLTETEKRRLMQGIWDGVAHLHRLGLVHNDLNPSNVMVGEDGAAVIIDLDSCRRQGEPMGLKGATPGWGTYTEYAVLESDLANLDQLERYLLG